MAKSKWKFLDRARHELVAGKRPEGMAMTLVDRIDAASAVSDPSRLAELNDELTRFIDSLLQSLPAGVLQAVRDGVGSPAVVAAHELGQLGFAQLLAARSAERRAPSAVQEAFRDPRYLAYIEALFRSEKTGIELAETVEQTAENVSRVLIDLRGLGIADFRKEGVRRINFLTPMAMAAYQETGNQVRRQRLAAMTPDGRARLEEERAFLPRHMQQAADFSVANPDQTALVP